MISSQRHKMVMMMMAMTMMKMMKMTTMMMMMITLVMMMTMMMFPATSHETLLPDTQKAFTKMGIVCSLTPLSLLTALGCHFSPSCFHCTECVMVASHSPILEGGGCSEISILYSLKNNNNRLTHASRYVPFTQNMRYM